MKRPLVVVGLLAISFVTFGPALDACGDKSLGPGGIRWQRALAAQYPASILIYVRPNSQIAAAAQELKLQDALRQVGHSYREVSTTSELEAALDSGQFNVVLADVSDLPDVQRRVDASRSRPATVGVAYKPTKAEAKEAASRYKFLIKAPGRSAQYLSTIADAVRSKSSGQRKA